MTGKSGLHDELGETGHAEYEKAAGHFAASPEEEGADQIHCVCCVCEADGVGEAEAGRNRSTAWKRLLVLLSEQSSMY